MQDSGGGKYKKIQDFNVNNACYGSNIPGVPLPVVLKYLTGTCWSSTDEEWYSVSVNDCSNCAASERAGALRSLCSDERLFLNETPLRRIHRLTTCGPDHLDLTDSWHHHPDFVGPNDLVLHRTHTHTFVTSTLTSHDAALCRPWQPVRWEFICGMTNSCIFSSRDSWELRGMIWMRPGRWLYCCPEGCGARRCECWTGVRLWRHFEETHGCTGGDWE